MTGSILAGTVGHSPYDRPFKVVRDACLPNKPQSKYGSDAKDWGTGKEVYAVECYVNDLSEQVTKTFRKQRLEFYRDEKNQGQQMTHFIFRTSFELWFCVLT
jgi:hypothetical protein